MVFLYQFSIFQPARFKINVKGPVVNYIKPQYNVFTKYDFTKSLNSLKLLFSKRLQGDFYVPIYWILFIQFQVDYLMHFKIFLTMFSYIIFYGSKLDLFEIQRDTNNVQLECMQGFFSHKLCIDYAYLCLISPRGADTAGLHLNLRYRMFTYRIHILLYRVARTFMAKHPLNTQVQYPLRPDKKLPSLRSNNLE